MDLTESIAPKSDQLNAEDLLSGPRTFTIAEVTPGSSEQPVEVHLVEHPGRPFKPSKTVRRMLVAAWGPDASVYPGRRLTLYRDPSVRFGGMEVGGIRVSHVSDITKPITLALTVTRGKRAPHVIQPLREAARPAQPTQPPAQQQGQPDRRAQAVAAFAGLGVSEAQLVSRVGKPVGEWTPDDLQSLLAVFGELRADPASMAQHFPTEAPAEQREQSTVERLQNAGRGAVDLEPGAGGIDLAADPITGERFDVEEPPGEEQ